jgi:PAS domain S-box-containing protein
MLLSTQARLEAGADLTGLGCYEVDFEEPSSFVDARFGAICGVPSGRQEGLETLKFWMDHLHPDDCQKVLEERIRLHEGGVDWVDLEYRYLHPAAGLKWIHHLARVAARNSAGRMIRSYGVIQDITERKQMLERIQAAAEQWQATFDAIQDLVLVLDRDFRILHINKSSASFFGRPGDQLAGCYCYDSVLWGKMPLQDCPVRKAYASRHHEECEFHHAPKDVWFLVTADPVFDSDGNIVGAINIYKDITDRKRYEKELVDNRAVQNLFTRRLLSIQEEERCRLARELHDDFSQRLAVLAMELSVLENLQQSGKSVDSALHTIRDQIVKLSTDIHDISRSFIPRLLMISDLAGRFNRSVRVLPADGTPYSLSADQSAADSES